MYGYSCELLVLSRRTLFFEQSRARKRIGSFKSTWIKEQLQRSNPGDINKRLKPLMPRLQQKQCPQNAQAIPKPPCAVYLHLWSRPGYKLRGAVSLPPTLICAQEREWKLAVEEWRRWFKNQRKIRVPLEKKGGRPQPGMLNGVFG